MCISNVDSELLAIIIMKNKLNLFFSVVSIIALFYVFSGIDNSVEIPEEVMQNSNKLRTLYSEEHYSEVIRVADSIIKENRNVETYLTFYRGSAYFQLKNYHKSLKDINHTIEKNGRGDYYLYFTRAKLYEKLNILDTAKICSDVSFAINRKGSIISSNNLELDHLDSTNLFDVNYIEMLKLRVKYCRKKMPSYTDLDQELIKKNR
jgi:tetratricopeptide (TPR) repeat protein